jgi:hypothetical protein
MDAVTVEQLEQIEAALTKRMIEVFGLEAYALILGMTNFATFIDSGNGRAPIARRGKAKPAASRNSTPDAIRLRLNPATYCSTGRTPVAGVIDLDAVVTDGTLATQPMTPGSNPVDAGRQPRQLGLLGG